MDKSLISILILFSTTVISVSGITFSMINHVQAQTDENTKVVATVPDMKEDIKEIKSDVKILLLNSRAQTNTFIEPETP